MLDERKQGLLGTAYPVPTVTQPVGESSLFRATTAPLLPGGDRLVTAAPCGLDVRLVRMAEKESSPAGIHVLGYSLIGCRKRRDRDRVVEQL